MATGVENEIVQLERQYWQALVEGDNETPVRLSDDPCIVAGAQGISSLDRQAIADMMKQASWKL
ncbi:MAG TPA: nuclear transport factor 2 family protein, partial [Polyangia bacterium]|nr:nuclear transport factor 2 family protein [Polyangia bacterium]